MEPDAVASGSMMEVCSERLREGEGPDPLAVAPFCSRYGTNRPGADVPKLRRRQLPPAGIIAYGSNKIIPRVEAESILKQMNRVDPAALRQSYEQEGWTRFGLRWPHIQQ